MLESMTSTAPYLMGIGIVAERLPNERVFPFNLRFLPHLEESTKRSITKSHAESSKSPPLLEVSCRGVTRFPSRPTAYLSAGLLRQPLFVTTKALAGPEG